MHQEQIVVSRKNVENLLNTTNVVAVGTTSLRTMESVYWYGVKLIQDSKATFKISQQDPYSQERPAVKKFVSFRCLEIYGRQQHKQHYG